MLQGSHWTLVMVTGHLNTELNPNIRDVSRSCKVMLCDSYVMSHNRIPKGIYMANRDKQHCLKKTCNQQPLAR